MKARQAISASLAAFIISFGGAAYGADHTCANTVAKELEKAQIDEGRIESVLYSRQILGDNYFEGYHVWVSLKGSPGYFMIDLDPTCRCRQVYTRGGCEVAGVKSF